jgi:hypothetical protein
MRSMDQRSGLTEAEVAKIVGITRGGVFMAERAIIRKLWRNHRELSKRFREMWGSE